MFNQVCEKIGCVHVPELYDVFFLLQDYIRDLEKEEEEQKKIQKV